MKYFLSKETVLKWLELPSVYHLKKDDLYELGEDAFEFLRRCSSEYGCDSEQSEFVDYCLKEDILTTERSGVIQPLPVQSPQPSLRYLELQITNRCNLRCRHCFIGDESDGCVEELTPEQIRKILKEFEEMQGLRVLITGGEPLTHNDFEEINKMLPEFRIRKALFTNGLLLSEGILEKLNVHEIQISIDGLEQAHDALRGKGTFRTAVRALEKAVKGGLETSVATMVHPLNLGDFDEMASLFEGMGVKGWTVDVPCAKGRLDRYPEFQISPEQGGKYLKYGYGGGLHSGASGFACGLHLASVTGDGRISRCTFYAEDSVGRIEEGLRTCWERIRPIGLEELACDCSHLEECRGGCRYRAQLIGDRLGKDLYRCALYDIL